MYKAVFRIEEVSTNALHLCAGHMTRELKETDLHIDKERIHKNITLIGSSSVVKVKSEVLDEMSKYKAHDSRTADSLATGIMTANKDYFDEEFAGWREDSSVLQPWIDANLKFLNSGHLSVVKSAVLHLDEEAPHIHFVAVPVANVTRGNRYGSKEYQRLNYNALFSDSLQHIEECRRLGTTSTDTKLGRLQTEYAKFVECVNLERGVTSEVRHVSPKRFRKMIQKKARKISGVNNSQLLTPHLLDYKKTHAQNAAKTSKIIKTLVDEVNKYADISAAKDTKIEQLNDKVKGQEKTIVKLQEQIREQASIIRENKDYIDAMRKLSKDDVIKSFSYKKEVYADYNFNKKFNAIDFVKHVEKCDFNTALVLVSEHFSEDDIKHIVVESEQIQTKVNQVMSNAIHKNDDLELESFKRDISLVDFAASHAFYTKNKSSSSATMVDGGSKIVVSRKNDNDVFFDVHDETKSGTIIDFCKHYLNLTSLGEIRKTLRAWIGAGTVEVKHAKIMRPNKEPTKLKPEPEDKTMAFYKLKNCADSVFLRKRGITIESDDIRIDERGNACFPHYDESGVICGWEVKNEKFKGFSAGGKKGFGQITLGNGKTDVVIAESMIDALSYAQLHDNVGVCMSTGGSASDEQLNTLARYVSDDVRVFIATDNDEPGQALAERLRARMTHAERALPVRKDWNDVLTYKSGPKCR